MKYVCNDVYDFLSSEADFSSNQHWYETAFDPIKSRIYNPPVSKNSKTKPKKLIKLHFVNKGMDMININTIINDTNVKKNLPIISTKQNKFQQYMH